MLQEVNGFMNLGSNKIAYRLCGYDGNDSAYLRFTTSKGPDLGYPRELYSVEAVSGRVRAMEICGVSSKLIGTSR